MNLSTNDATDDNDADDDDDNDDSAMMRATAHLRIFGMNFFHTKSTPGRAGCPLPITPGNKTNKLSKQYLARQQFQNEDKNFIEKKKKKTEIQDIVAHL